MQETNLSKYGLKSCWNSDKQKQTIIELYGVDNPAKSKEIQKKARLTRLFKNNNKYFSKDSINKILTSKKDTCFKLYNNPNYNNLEKIHKTVLKRYNKN